MQLQIFLTFGRQHIAQGKHQAFFFRRWSGGFLLWTPIIPFRVSVWWR